MTLAFSVSPLFLILISFNLLVLLLINVILVHLEQRLNVVLLQQFLVHSLLGRCFHFLRLENKLLFVIVFQTSWLSIVGNYGLPKSVLVKDKGGRNTAQNNCLIQNKMLKFQHCTFPSKKVGKTFKSVNKYK